MTTVFEKNLSVLKKYNVSLYEKMLKVVDIKSDIQLFLQNETEYNLSVEGTPVHSISGAEQEAKNILAKITHNKKTSMHVIFGLGLGYLLDVFSQNLIGSVIVYEQNLELLRLVFDVVDFEQQFARGNVFIVSDNKEFEELFGALFRYKSEISFSYIDFYKNYYSKELSLFVSNLQRLVNIYDFNFRYQVKENFRFLNYTLMNLDKKFSIPLLTDTKDMLKDCPAIIVSAGPSLNKNIEVLRKYKDKAFIFAVGMSVKTLNKAGIEPDFLNVIERIDTKAVYDLPVIRNSIFITEPFTSAATLDIDVRSRLLSVSLELDSNRWFLELMEKDLVPFETKGTVSYQALYSAMVLGCNPIILLGQDLAYIDGKCYSAGSAFEDLECVLDESTGKYKLWPRDFEKFRDVYYAPLPNLSEDEKNRRMLEKLEELTSKLRFVKGQDGKILPTDPGYALFIEYFKDFSKKFGDKVRLINSSVGGAQIDGYELMPLENVFSNVVVDDLDKATLLSCIPDSSNFDLSVVTKNLKADFDAVNKIIPLLEKGNKLLKSLKNDLSRTKSLNPSLKRRLSDIVDVYVDITNNYSNKNRVLKIVAYKENNELSYLLKNLSSSFSYDEAILLYNALQNYFVEVNKNLQVVIWYFNRTIGVLENESSNTES